MNYPHNTAILKAFGYYTSAIPEAKLQAAMKRGRELHAAVHILNRGDAIDQAWYQRHPDYEGYLEGARKFRFEHLVHMKRHEHIVVCEQERYITTIDEHMDLDGKDTILELKTGSRPNAIELQTGGQKRAMRLAGLAVPNTRRCMLLLLGNGNYKLEFFNDVRDEEEFVILCRAWHINNRRNVYGN